MNGDCEKILLNVENLRVVYKTDIETVSAVNGVSFSIRRGKTLGIVGETGAGKTTTALSILRLLPSTTGRILDGKVIFKGNDLLGFDANMMRAIRGNLIAMVFQDPMTSLNPLRTVGKQISEVMTAHKGLDRAEAKRQTVALLDRVGIPDASKRYNQYPHEFSGGMRQRVVIAIAVACGPEILICDEPTTALDVTIQAQILDLIRSIQREMGITVVYITHDLGVVANVADRVAVMYAGEIVEYGTSDEVFFDPKHPYTWALLSSLPQLGVKGEPLYNIEGVPPNLFNEITGDAFAPRNPKALKIDFVENPPYFKVTDTHYAKTWLLDGRAPKIEPPDAVKRLKSQEWT